MSRSFVSFVVACGLLVQSAPHGHGHPGEMPAGHDLRPHVHTNQLLQTESGHHHHGPGGHHHGEPVDPPPAVPAPVPPGESPGDHDDDAVDLTADLIHAAGQDGAGTTSARAADADLTATLPPMGFLDLAGHATPQPHPPPEPGRPACPTYVRHLALLL